ncbi:hypothetical protein CKM354_000046300 [Cercospora kikuchii]|uniref:Uncharacterized protein n=1 Tax=Cercospora kikuchii TaxID=84275 RepID=A0A9P3C3X5_9PEZI|nr:uncharacterized protein CKM354_000046300 [Cercospora kikuchii]GIZ36999.1 hypothetical protein CKM354_000046300 [Cercospora kikuchii]
MSPRTQDALGRKAGRFDPSEPLHMTTRHAAKKGRPNGTPSINGSVEDNDSRRESLDGVRPTTAQSLGSQSSLKGRRISGESANSTSDVNMSFSSHRSANKKVSRDFSDHSESPIQQTGPQTSQSPSRKRKRTYSTPSIPHEAATIAKPAILLHGTEEDLNTYKDALVVAPQEDQMSDQESAGSSSGQDAVGYLAATQSTEITPAATPLDSEPVSPVSEETNPTPRYPGKHLDSIMLDAGNPAEEEDMDEMDEDDVANVGEDGDDLADAEDDDDLPTTGPRRRMTGRRRADHHEIDIEATMRRQAQLKSAYRAIARALKPLLAEIASKTVDELEANPALHQEVNEYEGTEEYEGVRKLLDEALEHRKRQLDAQLEYNRKQIWQRLQGERRACSKTLEYEVENMRQRRVDEGEYELLQIARYVQLEQNREQEVTDDEDGDVLPRPQQTGYRFARTGPLDPRHESRSRLALDTEKAIADMQQRFEMHKMLQDAMQNEDSQDTGSFTVMDSTAREAALAKRESIRNTSILADAATEVDRISNIPVIPNEEAVGLQLLGDLASRPSVRAAVPHPATPRRLDQAFVPLHEQNHMPPPGAVLGPPPFAMRHQPPPQMSPGTVQFIERSIPYSPRRFASMDGHSERPPWEPSLMSPTSSSENRLSTFPALASLLQSPSLNLPGRRDSVPRQHHRHAPHEFQHQRHSSHDMAQFQRSTPRGSIGGLLSDLDRSEPSMPGAQGREDTSWDKYHRPMSRDVEARPFPRIERAVHEFSRGGPLSIERLAPPQEAERIEETRIEIPAHEIEARRVKRDEVSEPRPEDEVGIEADAETELKEEEVQGVKSASPVLGRQSALRDRSSEQPSSEGAIDPRLLKEDESRVSRAPRALSEDTQLRKPRSRASSLGQSTTTDVSGSQDGDRGLRRQTKDGHLHHGKTSRAERNGLSRKAHKETKRTQNKRANNTMRAGTEGGSKMFRFRLNTMESTKTNPFSSRTPTGTPHTPQHTAETPYAPLPSYVQQPPSSGFSAPYGPNPPPQYQPEPYYHRNSLPGAGPPPQGPWPHPHYGPGYPNTQVAPPLGPRPDNWPAGAPPPPTPSQASAPPNPPPFGSQYGGPAIAPATSDSRYPFGTGPPGGNHLPAFAQQQRNSEGGGGSRRRTQSDAPRQTKFHHYAGPRNR